MPARSTLWARLGIANRRGRRSSVLTGPRRARAEDPVEPVLAVACLFVERPERAPDALAPPGFLAADFLPADFLAPLVAAVFGFASWPGRISLKSAALSVRRFGTG